MAKKKILVVDDSETLCDTLRARLEENGNYEVRTENRGNLALSAAKQYQPDLMLLDILMPQIDGVSVAIAIKQDPQVKDVPIIFLTAVAQTEDVQQHGNMFGGYYVLPKSVSTEKLIQVIEENILNA